MSLLRPLLRPTNPSAPSRTIASASGVAARSNVDARQDRRRRVWSTASRDNDSRCAPRRRGGDDSAATIEDVFIRSLVAAGTCRTCASPVRSTAASNTRWKKSHTQITLERTERASVRAIHTSTHAQQHNVAFAATQEPENTDISREQFKDLVDTYDSPSDLWEIGAVPPPRPPSPQTAPPREHLPLAPRLVLTPEQEARSLPARRHLLRLHDPDDIARRDRLALLLHEDLGSRTNEIWEVYCSLPEPRPAYLETAEIHLLFRQLAWVEAKDATAATRYLGFLQECLDANFQPLVSEWNTAIAFAGRRSGRVSTDDLKRAVETWMRMDSGNEEPDHVTFNILYDLASRAGRFALADTVLAELVARGSMLDRYHRTSTILNAGLRRDGDAVRRAFREFVNAGEIVDTAVMNCVVLSLVRAGETPSAESVVQKMKNLHAAKREPSFTRTWREEKALGRRLQAVAKDLRREKAAHESSFFGSAFSNQEHKEAAQRLAPIAPDRRTYAILLREHCHSTGNLGRVRDLLAELRVEQDGKIWAGVYIWLFKGFHKWGGYAFNEWNRKALEALWAEFVDAVEKKQPDRRDVATTTTGEGTTSFAAGDEQPAYRPFFGTESGKPSMPAQLTHNTITISSNQTLGNKSGRLQESTDTNTASELEDDDLDLDDGFPKSFPVEESTPFNQRKPRFSTYICCKVIFAFYKCAGPKRARTVWAEIQDLWGDMTEEERARIVTTARVVLNEC